MGRKSAVHQAGKPKVDLDTLTARQRGLITRRQAIACGMDDDGIRVALSDGRWQRVLPGQYATFTGELTLEHKRIAAALQLQGLGQLTGLAALAWHGFRNIPEYVEIHMLVSHSFRRVSRGFVRVQRTAMLDEHPHRAEGYLVCSVARAVADACRLLDDMRDVRAIVAESVQRRLTTPARLNVELDRAGKNRTRLLRIALSEIATGVRSPAEIDLQKVLAPVRSIRFEWNPILCLPDGGELLSPDAWVPDAAIAIEVDSREYHLSPEDWQRTMRRHNLLSQYGVVVLHFTPSEIRNHPRRVRVLVEATYRKRIEANAAAGIRITSHPAQ